MSTSTILDTEILIEANYDGFKRFVYTEVKEGHGRIREELRVHMDNKFFVERLWDMLFAIKRDLEKSDSSESREMTHNVMSLASRIATTELLIRAQNEDFEAIVNTEVRRSGVSRVRALLGGEELIDRWRLCLILMKKSVEAQMGARSDDVQVLRVRIGSPTLNRDEQRAKLSDNEIRQNRIEAHRRALEQFVAWRAGAKRFKLSIEERLLEVQRIQLDQRLEEGASVRELVEAIERHKEQMRKEYEDDDISPFDMELWSVLGRTA